MDACTVMKREKRHNASGISNEGMQFLAMGGMHLHYDAQFPSVKKASHLVNSQTHDPDLKYIL